MSSAALLQEYLMRVRLSFDDGPGPSTPELLDVLRDAACPALFFVLGKHLENAPEVAIRMVREGHVIGNHTGSHARPGALSAAQLIAEIEATDTLIRCAWRDAGLPVPVSIPLRLPYGIDARGVEAADPRLDVLARIGRSHTGWTAILDDWRRPAPSAQDLLAAMRRHIDEHAAQGQDVLLCLHDSSPRREAQPATVEAVRRLLALQAVLPTTQKTHAGARRP
jgi:chitin deacetylase